jgi:hypothetical protein
VSIAYVCVHTATPITQSESDDEMTWAAGEPDETTETGAPFPCCLFLPLGPARQDTKGRQVREPTLLWDSLNEEGEPIPQVRINDELLIVAPELTGEAAVRWQVLGEPQPLGAPGWVKGYQATLVRVSDGAEGPAEPVENEEGLGE